MDPLLYIALLLSILTYYIGVLIYSIPVPIRSFKRWAPILIQDGFISALLTYLNIGILVAIDKLRQVIGGSLAVTALITRFVQDIIIIALTLIKGFSAVISLVARFNISAIFSPITYALMITMGEVVTLGALASIIANARTRLFIVGLILYAIPFRIGRSAGASIIAFIIVNELLLPLFPYWLLYIYGSLEPRVAVKAPSIAYVWGYVKGIYGLAEGSIVTFKHVEGNTTQVFTFLARENGEYLAGRPDKGIPYGSYTLYVEYLGFTFRAGENVSIPEDLEVDTSIPQADYRLDILIPVVIPCPETLVYVRGNYSSIHAYPYSDNEVIIKIHGLNSNVTLALSMAETNLLKIVTVLNATIVPGPKLSYMWRGVNVYTQYYSVIPFTKNSTVSIILEYKEGKIIYPQVEETQYTLTHSIPVFNEITALAWEFIRFDIVVAMFLTLDVLLVFGLARFIGGDRVRMLIPL